MRDELKYGSSAGIEFEGMNKGHKALAMVVSIAVSILIVVLPVVL
jgi:hypothetical protein